MVRNYKRKTIERWSKEDLLEALFCIKERKLKVMEASSRYGISRATLYRHYQRFILTGCKCDVNQFRTSGGNPMLSNVEEGVLEKTIIDLREGGHTVKITDIKRICFEYCEDNGIPNQFNREKRMASDDWYHGFVKRHPNVRMPKPGGGSGASTPALSLSGANGSSPMISAAGAQSPAEMPLIANTFTHQKLQLVPSHESTVLFATTGKVATFHDTTCALQTASSISTPIPPKEKKKQPAAAIIIPPASPFMKKSLKRLGVNRAAKRDSKGTPEPSIHIMKSIFENEYEFEGIEEDESVEDMEDDVEQDDAMELDGEDSEGNEDAESGAEEEEEDEEEEESDETGEVEDDDVGAEETEVGEEVEQEEEGENEGKNGDQQGKDIETAESKQARRTKKEEREEEQKGDCYDDDDVKDEKEDSGSEEDLLLSDFIMFSW